MNGTLPILVAEDDDNDVLLLQRAFLKNGIQNPVYIARDGEDAVAYLEGSGRYSDRQKFPFPSVLITDLKMPRKNGFEILQWLRDHPECRLFQVIVLSASSLEQDRVRAYQMGAHAYIQKPSLFFELNNYVRIINEFWRLCENPPQIKSYRAEREAQE